MKIKGILLMTIAIVGVVWSDQAWALCEVHTSDRTYADGSTLSGSVCNENGALKVTGGTGGGGAVIKDGTGDTTEMNVDNGRAQVQNYNPNLAADNSTNSASKVPVLGCVATAAVTAWTEGRQVPCRTDLTGSLVVRHLDPCSGVGKQYLPINISSATTTEITASLAGSSNHYYVCSINIGPVAGAQNLALVDDDSDGCGSVTSGLAGGTTAGSGWNIAANGGLTMGDGLGSIARTGGTNRVLCLVSSTTAQTSGVITVVAAP